MASDYLSGFNDPYFSLNDYSGSVNTNPVNQPNRNAKINKVNFNNPVDKLTLNNKKQKKKDGFWKGAIKTVLSTGFIVGASIAGGILGGGIPGSMAAGAAASALVSAIEQKNGKGKIDPGLVCIEAAIGAIPGGVGHVTAKTIGQVALKEVLIQKGKQTMAKAAVKGGIIGAIDGAVMGFLRNFSITGYESGKDQNGKFKFQNIKFGEAAKSGANGIVPGAIGGAVVGGAISGTGQAIADRTSNTSAPKNPAGKTNSKKASSKPTSSNKNNNKFKPSLIKNGSNNPESVESAAKIIQLRAAGKTDEMNQEAQKALQTAAKRLQNIVEKGKYIIDGDHTINAFNDMGIIHEVLGDRSKAEIFYEIAQKYYEPGTGRGSKPIYLAKKYNELARPILNKNVTTQARIKTSGDPIETLDEVLKLDNKPKVQTKPGAKKSSSSKKRSSKTGTNQTKKTKVQQRDDRAETSTAKPQEPKVTSPEATTAKPDIYDLDSPDTGLSENFRKGLGPEIKNPEIPKGYKAGGSKTDSLNIFDEAASGSTPAKTETSSSSGKSDSTYTGAKGGTGIKLEASKTKPKKSPVKKKL